MGDHMSEKGRDSRRKKFYTSSKEREEKHYGSRRLPIILTKPDSERDKDGSRAVKKVQESQEKPLSQPTIILRTRDGDNRAVSPSQRSITASRQKKENETQSPQYHLAAKHSNTENVSPLAPPPEMKSSIKLIDDSFQMSDACLEFLTDQPDFLVVGVLGLQGVGKSTLMSHLAGNPASQLTDTLFKVETYQQQESAGYCTSGVDFVVTPNRMILLDTQPMLSGEIMEKISQETKKVLPACSVDIAIDNIMEVQSLQIAAFILSVCHVVLVVQDWFFDPNFLRFIQTAEMLKPPTPTTSQDEELVEYFPHVMFVHTNTLSSYFSKDRLQLMQDTYSKIFARSRLQIQSGIGMAPPTQHETIQQNSDGTTTATVLEPVNIFLLPDIVEEENAGYYTGHPNYALLIQTMKHQIQGITINPLTHTTLPEKNWFYYASKIWDGIKKSVFFHEYSKLLPQ